MISDDRLEQAILAYQAALPLLDAFRVQLEHLVRVLLTNEGIEIHHIESRCKTVESFEEKVRRKGYADPLKETTDLVGMRIIVYYNSDVSFAAGLIQREFAVDPAHSTDWRLPIEADRFGYESLHLVVSLDERRTRLLEWRPFASMRAELQIRTVLQHAWAAVSHQLSYKAERGLSPEGLRRLNRIAAVLEGADAEFDAIRSGQGQLDEAPLEPAEPSASQAQQSEGDTEATPDLGSQRPDGFS